MTDYLIYLTIAMFITQCLDFYTTRAILNKGGKELNPVAKWFMDEFGIDGFLAGKTVVVTALGYYVGSQQWWMLVGLILFYVFVLIYNWRSMPK